MAVTEKEVHEQDKLSFKVVMLGPAGAGKSALRARVDKKQENFLAVYKATIGVEFTGITFDISEKKVDLLVWEVPGQERLRGMSSSFTTTAHAILICCDLTDPEMWQKAAAFLDQNTFPRPEKAMLVLVGTKMDDENDKVLVKENEKKLIEQAKKLECECRFTSAKTLEGVTELFAGVAQQLIAQKSQQIFQKEESKGTVLTASKNILNTRAKYIEHLEKVWEKASGNNVEKALEILEDYTKDFRRSKYKGEELKAHWNLSALYRFFSGHWNRHYVKKLSEIHNSTERPKRLDAIIEQLEGIKKAAEKENKFNSQGDLAAIIAFLNQQSLAPQNNGDISKDFVLM